jgi:hypothetical protein
MGALLHYFCRERLGRRLVQRLGNAHPPQQTICNPWRATRARGQFEGAFAVDTDSEQMRRR